MPEVRTMSASEARKILEQEIGTVRTTGKAVKVNHPMRGPGWEFVVISPKSQKGTWRVFDDPQNNKHAIKL